MVKNMMTVNTMHPVKLNKDIDFNALSEKSHDSAWLEAEKDDEMNVFKIACAGGANETMLKYIEESKDYHNIVFA